MYATKRAVAMLAAAAIIGFLVGFAIFVLLDIGSLIPPGSIVGILLGRAAGSFSMRVSLFATVGTILLVPDVRQEFFASYSAGQSYKRSQRDNSI